MIDYGITFSSLYCIEYLITINSSLYAPDVISIMRTPDNVFGSNNRDVLIAFIGNFQQAMPCDHIKTPIPVQ